MLPVDGELTSEPIPSGFFGAAALPFSRSISYADGGIAVGDPSAGLMYQVWEARIEGEGLSIMLYAPNQTPALIRTGDFITDVSLAFDSQMRPAVAFVDSGVSYLQWFNPEIGGVETINLGGASTVAINPKITFDYKLTTLYPQAGLILAYINGGQLHVREEQTQFREARLLDPGPFIALNRIGLGVGYRMQFQCVREEEG